MKAIEQLVAKKKEKKIRNGKKYEYLKYYFEIEKCRNCPKHDDCVKNKVRKILHISINTPEFYEISKWQKSEEFKEKYKKRAPHEAKNGEMKSFHGLSRARGYSLKSMSLQAKFTALAVNLKRIAKLVAPLNLSNSYKMVVFGW